MKTPPGKERKVTGVSLFECVLSRGELLNPVLQCLDPVDVFWRLKRTSTRVNHYIVETTSGENNSTNIRYWKDLQVLVVLQCERKLLARAAAALRSGRFRIVRGMFQRQHLTPSITLYEQQTKNGNPGGMRLTEAFREFDIPKVLKIVDSGNRPWNRDILQDHRQVLQALSRTSRNMHFGSYDDDVLEQLHGPSVGLGHRQVYECCNCHATNNWSWICPVFVKLERSQQFYCNRCLVKESCWFLEYFTSHVHGPNEAKCEAVLVEQGLESFGGVVDGVAHGQDDGMFVVRLYSGEPIFDSSTCLWLVCTG